MNIQPLLSTCARHFAAVCAPVLLTSAAMGAVPLPDYKLLPVDAGSGPTDRDVPFLAWHEDLSANGYVELEYQLSGLANIYEYADNASESPAVQIKTAGQPYVTRMLVRRPAKSKKFNGVIYLEILNATAGYDGAPMWNLTYPSIIADGAAWVGVTYSDVTARFMRDNWGVDGPRQIPDFEPRDNSRYANLNISTRAHTWDIINQAAALLKARGIEQSPMGNAVTKAIIVTGYSQSAGYVTTFSNSFYPSYSEADPCYSSSAAGTPCKPVTDGFIVAAGGPVARLLEGVFSHKLGDKRNFERSGGKTVRFTTESDIKSARVRQTQQEAPRLRTYEVAGGSHVDYWADQTGQVVAQYQFGATGDGWPCDLPLNPIRTGIPLSAIQHRLARWIKDGLPPPDSTFMQVTGDFDNDTAEWVRDIDGNAIGGVRTVRIDVPLGSYAGSNPYSGPSPSVGEIFCKSIIGSFDAFSEAELRERYNDRRTFRLMTWWNAWMSYKEGFLLPVDAPVILRETREFDGLPRQNRSRRPRP